MKLIKTVLSGLLVSVVLLLPAVVRAADLEPFLTIKASSINTLVNVAEKVGALGNFADEPPFREVVNAMKDVRGFNLDGDFGIAAVVANDGSLNVVLVLPITDLWAADIPANPEIFGFIRPGLIRRAPDRADIVSPMGAFTALQKEGYLVVAPGNIIDQVPADARTLFADLDKYTLGVKLNLEKVEFETLEANLFGPMLFVAMMQDPMMGEQLGNMIDIYRELYKEFSGLSYGIAFNPQTADVELAYSISIREGSDFSKSMAGYKQQPTVFGGFRSTPGNTVLSLGDAGSWTPIDLENNAMFEAAMKPYEAIFEGIIEQIDMDDETGEAAKIARDVIETLKKIYFAEAKRGASDYAASFNTDGTLLLAFDTVSLSEIEKLAAMAVGFASRKIGNDFGFDFSALRLNYTTVGGFAVSSYKLPIEKIADELPGQNEGLKEFSPGVFWAVKRGQTQAVAVAVGLDFAKAEQAFTEALGKTATAVPVQKPIGMLSLRGLGAFLQQTIWPAAAKDGAPEEIKTIIDMLASADADAVIALDCETKGNQIALAYTMSGKAIQTIVSVVKAAAEMNESADRPAIRDF